LSDDSRGSAKSDQLFGQQPDRFAAAFDLVEA